MKMETLVSIITITRNRSDIIGRCIESIQNQSYYNHEHIIIDGNSTDNTEAIVDGYAKKDSRIKYKKIAVYGPSIQMKEGYKLCNGKYIAFLDDDDEYLPNKIEKQVLKFNALNDDYGLVYCWMTYIDSKTNKKIFTFSHNLKGFVGPEAASQPCVSGTPTLMVRRSVIPAIGGIYNDEKGLIGADWEFAARVCQKYKVDVVKESLVNVYINHNHTQLTNINANKRIDDQIKFSKYFLKQFADMFSIKPKCAIPHYKNLGKLYMEKQQYSLAFRYFVKCIQLSPSIKNMILPIYYFIKQIFK